MSPGPLSRFITPHKTPKTEEKGTKILKVPPHNPIVGVSISWPGSLCLLASDSPQHTYPALETPRVTSLVKSKVANPDLP